VQEGKRGDREGGGVAREVLTVRLEGNGLLFTSPALPPPLLLLFSSSSVIIGTHSGVKCCCLSFFSFFWFPSFQRPFSFLKT
jgi:hypothetical protein